MLLSSTFIYNSMGSIDESAIQALSLVVNLTKHIHLRSKENGGDDEDVAAEDYQPYFPQFYWAVRDFALQLVDQDD